MENRYRPPSEETPGRQKQERTSRKSTGNGTRLLKTPALLIRQLLDGTLFANEKVVKNIPYILFIAGLAILYITNSATAERNRRELVNLTDELKELRYKYISTKSSVMFLSNQSQISERLKETGIRESTVPPVKIFVKTPSENE